MGGWRKAPALFPFISHNGETCAERKTSPITWFPNLVPKTRAILEGYLELTRAASLSADEQDALTRSESALVRLPALYESQLRALREGRLLTLVTDTELLEATSLAPVDSCREPHRR